MKFFKPQPCEVKTANGVELGKATERNASGYFIIINRQHCFVPFANIVRWI